MNLDICPGCESSDVSEIVYDGYFEFESKRYPLKTKFTKCQKCNREYYSLGQIEENQEYLRSVNRNPENLLPN